MQHKKGRSLMKLPIALCLASVIMSAPWACGKRPRSRSVLAFEMRRAAARGDNAKLAQLLAEGADPNSRDPIGRGITPLHVAALNGQLATVRFLIERGANVNATNAWGDSALHVASANGYADIVSLLVEKGAHLSRFGQSGDTPLAQARRAGHEAVVKLLTRHGAIDENCISALNLAVAAGETQTIQDLISRGADPNRRDFDGRSLLHIAAATGQAEAALVLVKNGASVDARDKKGRTPLHQAALGGDDETVALLLTKGANANSKDNDGCTPLDLALASGWISAAKILREHGGLSGRNSTQSDK